MGWSWKRIANFLRVSEKRLYLHRKKFRLEEPFRVIHDPLEAREIVGPIMAENPQCGERVLKGRLFAIGKIHTAPCFVDHVIFRLRLRK